MLDLKAALDLFDSGKWVSLAFVCADKQKGTYGRIVRIPKCRKLTRLANNGNSAPRLNNTVIRISFMPVPRP